jgi:hypothetical protein
MDLAQMMALMQQQQRGGGDAGASAMDTLFSCKAGRCVSSSLPGSGNFIITPANGKGELSVKRTTAASPDGEGLLHFIWTDRKTKENGEDMILFPNEANFERVDTPRPGDRVYVLRDKNRDRRVFFWMQDMDDSKDEEMVAKINKFINSSIAATAAAGGDEDAWKAPDPEPANPAANDSMNTSVLNTSAAVNASGAIDSANLASIMSGLAPATTTSATSSASANPTITPATGTTAEGDDIAAATPSPGAVNVNNLQNILAGLGLPETTPAGVYVRGTPPAPVKPGAAGLSVDMLQGPLQGALAGVAAQQANTEAEMTPLTETVSADAVMESQILSDPDVVAKLLPLLPAGQQTQEQLVENLRSPQVRQALGSLQSAIAGDNFNSVLANFQLDTSSPRVQEAMNSGNMILAFLESVIDSVERK